MEQSPESSSATYDGYLLERWQGVSERELLEALSDQVAALQAQMDGLLALLREYGDQIKPTIDAMSKSPIMKVLGVKSNAG